MKFYISILCISLLCQSCMKSKKVDLIIHNATIFTVDLNYSTAEAMAVKDGKIVEIGPERQILNKYTSEEIIDAQGKDIFPGFSDAHGHLLSLIDQRLSLDLTGSKSFEELLFKLEKYISSSKSKRKFIVGRGWDQSLWNTKKFPTNEQLNKRYPNTPILLIRVDGHAALVNDCLLKLAKLDENSVIEGGKILLDKGKPSGIILDNAISKVSALIPPFSLKEKQDQLIEIQQELFQYGITSVHEAGINYDDIRLFQSLNQSEKLELQVYAMLYPTPKNFAFAKKNGIYEKRNLFIRSFKVVGDGALGSRGACLKHPYHDDPSVVGFLTTSPKDLQLIAREAREIGYQMNTHAIGDSTNKLIIDIIADTYRQKKDHRWRIEHAQVLDVNDIPKLGQYAIFPSVQPTHAVSDQRWAEDRLGRERLKGAYAYQSILNSTGIFAFGTDFPVEHFNPFLTIHAAVKRKNSDNFPPKGFLNQEAVSLQNCIQAMTIWAAFASFREHQSGSLEKGKEASFVILEHPLKVSDNFSPNFAYMTFIKGKKVYSAE